MTTASRTVPPPGQTDDYGARPPAGGAAPAAGAAITVRDGNSVAWRRAEIPAGNGFGNARSVALVQSVLACGGTVRGVRLLSPEGCARAWQEQFSGVDQILGGRMRYGLGYGLFGDSFGWGGWGGSLVIIDPAARMVTAFVTNQMAEPGSDGEYRGMEVVMAAQEGLAALKA
jgi:CubicO group peptidase (beta-lactamase class C family)